MNILILAAAIVFSDNFDDGSLGASWLELESELTVTETLGVLVIEGTTGPTLLGSEHNGALVCVGLNDPVVMEVDMRVVTYPAAPVENWRTVAHFCSCCCGAASPDSNNTVWFGQRNGFEGYGLRVRDGAGIHWWNGFSADPTVWRRLRVEMNNGTTQGYVDGVPVGPAVFAPLISNRVELKVMSYPRNASFRVEFDNLVVFVPELTSVPVAESTTWGRVKEMFR